MCYIVPDLTTFQILGQKFIKFCVGFLENLRHQKVILRLTDLQGFLEQHFYRNSKLTVALKHQFHRGDHNFLKLHLDLEFMNYFLNLHSLRSFHGLQICDTLLINQKNYYWAGTCVSAPPKFALVATDKDCYRYRPITVKSRVLTRVTSQEINFLSKGHST